MNLLESARIRGNIRLANSCWPKKTTDSVKERERIRGKKDCLFVIFNPHCSRCLVLLLAMPDSVVHVMNAHWPRHNCY